MVALCIEPYKVQSSLLTVRYPNKTLSPRLHINAKHLCMSLQIHAVISGVLLLFPISEVALLLGYGVLLAHVSL